MAYKSGGADVIAAKGTPKVYFPLATGRHANASLFVNSMTASKRPTTGQLWPRRGA